MLQRAIRFRYYPEIAPTSALFSLNGCHHQMADRHAPVERRQPGARRGWVTRRATPATVSIRAQTQRRTTPAVHVPYRSGPFGRNRTTAAPAPD